MKALFVSIILLSCFANAQSPKTAAYYANLQVKYQQKAAAAKALWLERSKNAPVSLYAKYPRPADSAKNLYEYYTTKAAEAGKLKDKYSK
jgi:hypothetical protein